MLYRVEGLPDSFSAFTRARGRSPCAWYCCDVLLLTFIVLGCASVLAVAFRTSWLPFSSSSTCLCRSRPLPLPQLTLPPLLPPLPTLHRCRCMPRALPLPPPLLLPLPPPRPARPQRLPPRQPAPPRLTMPAASAARCCSRTLLCRRTPCLPTAAVASRTSTSRCRRWAERSARAARPSSSSRSSSDQGTFPPARHRSSARSATRAMDTTCGAGSSARAASGSSRRSRCPRAKSTSGPLPGPTEPTTSLSTSSDHRPEQRWRLLRHRRLLHLRRPPLLRLHLTLLPRPIPRRPRLRRRRRKNHVFLFFSPTPFVLACSYTCTTSLLNLSRIGRALASFGLCAW